MSRRRPVRLLLLGVLLAAAAISSVLVRPVSTVGSPESDAIVAATGGTRDVTSVLLEWNRDARDSTRPGSVRVSTQDGQMFEAGDTVNVIAAGAGSDTCSAMTTITKRAAVADLEFSACGIMLWDVQGVAVDVSEEARGAALKSNAGVHRGSLVSFDGPVVQHDATVKTDYSTSSQAGQVTLTTLRLSVGGATADQLVGRQLVSILSTANELPTTWTGTVGTSVSNQGVWVEWDSRTAATVVIADISRLAGGQAPRGTVATQYRMVLLQPQCLGVGQTSANRYAFITAAGTVED